MMSTIGASHGVAAQAVVEPWASENRGTRAVAVGAAALAGGYAAAFADGMVEVRDIRGGLLGALDTRGFDPPAGDRRVLGLAWSDSSRLLFVATRTDASEDELIYRYDTEAGEVTRFATLDLGGAPASPAALAFYRGELWVGVRGGSIVALDATRDSIGPDPRVVRTIDATPAGVVRSLAVDRDGRLLFAASANGLFRADLEAPDPALFRFDARETVVSLVSSPAFGADGQEGLVILQTEGGGSQSIELATYADARGQTGRFRSRAYLELPRGGWSDVSATACGRVLGASTGGPIVVSDSGDARLGFEDWLGDEFGQVLAYTRALIREDGWVLDGSPLAGEAAGPPATPDGALWAVLVLLTARDLDPEANADAEELVERVLVRYAGMAGDGASPARSADGLFEHWIDPSTGSVFGGFPQEYAVYSTMKIVLGADRARRAFPANRAIGEAASRIVCEVRAWASYFDENDGVFLIGEANGGPMDPGPRNRPFVEGILFAEQASAFAGPDADAVFDRWIDRDRWPAAEFIADRPVTGAVAGVFQPAFITVYPMLTMPAFRDDARWREHALNLFESFKAWTDDEGPRYATAFSAGGGLSGYHADSLSNHPGDITHFPALMATGALGRTDGAVAAYHAYRRGARSDLAVGASMLVRRSDEAPAWESGVGLPDAAYGALVLAELISPGVIDRVVSMPLADVLCRGDLNDDRRVDAEDAYLWNAAPIDVNDDARADDRDLERLLDLARDAERLPRRARP